MENSLNGGVRRFPRHALPRKALPLKDWRATVDEDEHYVFAIAL